MSCLLCKRIYGHDRDCPQYQLGDEPEDLWDFHGQKMPDDVLARLKESSKGLDKNNPWKGGR